MTLVYAEFVYQKAILLLLHSGMLRDDFQQFGLKKINILLILTTYQGLIMVHAEYTSRYCVKIQGFCL